MTREQDDINDSAIGGNASEVPEESRLEGTVCGLDIVINHNLQLMSYSKEGYKSHIRVPESLYTGASVDPAGMVALLDVRGRQTTPYMRLFDDGMEMEKV